MAKGRVRVVLGVLGALGGLGDGFRSGWLKGDLKELLASFGDACTGLGFSRLSISNTLSWAEVAPCDQQPSM